MYNVIMQGIQWKPQGRWELEQSRVFEYTELSIKNEYKNNLNRLREFPCLFSCEGYNDYGSIGWIRAIQLLGRSVYITYQFDDSFPKFPIDSEKKYSLFGVLDWEVNRTHWAVKNGNLFEILAKIYASEYKKRITVLSREDMERIWGSNPVKSTLIFLSHKASNAKKVSQLAKQLEENKNIKTFVAHEDIHPSRQWAKEILRALNTMDFFIGIITEDFHNGGWTDQEIGYCLKRGIPRLFLKLSETDPKGFINLQQALTCTWDNASEKIIKHLEDNEYI